MQKPAPRLGKGLSALIATRSQPLAAPTTDGGGIQTLDVEKIAPNPRQPRSSFDEEKLAELADSIRTHGILQPILVRKLADDSYELIAGERRLRTAKLAGQQTIPAIVRPMNERDATEAALIENLQRDDLTPIDRAVAYRQYLHVFGAVPEQLATRLGESRASVANYLRLLTLHAEIQQMLADGRLEMGHARAILSLPAERRLAVAQLAYRRNLSVRQIEEMAVDAAPDPQTEPREEREIASRAERGRLNELGQVLTRAIGLRVTLSGGKRKNSGRIVIHYNNLDEFDALARRLGAPTSLE